MFYEIFYPLSGQYHILNLFRYVTFRSAYAALTAFLLSLMCGPLMIRYLTRIKVGQSIRDDGPKSHLSKVGTPTMGGVLMLWSMLLSSVLWARLDNRYVWIGLGAVSWFGFVGFIDDFKKLVLKTAKGRAPS